MKKQLLLVCAVIALGASCAATTATISFDENIPPEESAWIGTLVYGRDEGMITGYNGISVDWPAGEMIQIPAGETVLEWNFSGSFSGKNVVFRYNFKPARRYYFFVVRKDRKYGLNVYESGFDDGMFAMIDEKNFVEFVPFETSGERLLLQ
jgi:hypothetical protein